MSAKINAKLHARKVDAALQGREIEGWLIGDTYHRQPRVSRLYHCQPRTSEFVERAQGRKCLCKYISPLEGEDRMEGEYQANRDLQECPYIVRPIYVSSQKYEGGYLIFMQAYQMVDALDYLIEMKPLLMNEVRGIIRNVCVAIHYMHELDYVHRDIKLENIFIGDGEIPEAFLGDLGFAEQLEGEYFTDNWLCTPPSASPEVLDRKPYGKPADMWALGVCLFTLITGRRPFGVWDEDDKRSCDEYLENARRGWYSLHDVPPEAHALVMGLLEVDPSKRLTAEQALNDSFLPVPKPDPI